VEIEFEGTLAAARRPACSQSIHGSPFSSSLFPCATVGFRHRSREPRSGSRENRDGCWSPPRGTTRPCLVVAFTRVLIAGKPPPAPTVRLRVVWPQGASPTRHGLVGVERRAVGA
jgi:hypothetical protein